VVVAQPRVGTARPAPIDAAEPSGAPAREEVEYGEAGGVGDRIRRDWNAFESRLQRRISPQLQGERDVDQHKERGFLTRAESLRDGRAVQWTKGHTSVRSGDPSPPNSRGLAERRSLLLLPATSA
jgi:hypothetical protein